jgi:UPF0755 protein
MSDKTRRDEFDELDDLDLGFPGQSAEDWGQEQSFTFDEDYLSQDFSLPRQRAAPEEEPALDKKAQENALFDAMRKLTGSLAAQKEAPAKESPKEPKAEAPKTEATKAETPKAPQKPQPQRTRTAAKSETAKPTRSLAVRKSGGNGLSASGWRRKKDYGPREPVPIGEQLRSDEMLVYDSELDEVDYTDAEDMPELRDYLPVRFARHGRSGVGGGILYGLFVISVSIVLACFAWMCASDVLALNKEEKSAVVTIDAYEPTGDMPTTTTVNDQEVTITADIDQVATALKNAGIIEYKWLFKIFGQLSHANTKIDAGTYDVSTELDYRALVTTLQFGSGKQEVTRVTFPEGLTIDQVFALLEENQICHTEDLYEAAANYDFDYDFLEDIPLGDATRLEGYLFPDTYDFYQGESATVALTRFLNNTKNKLDGMESQANAKGMTLHEIITVASLIEKEAGSDEERATIASVIYNRLNAGWKLQLDSTVNYILGTSTFDLTMDSLEIDSPYNTYLYEGLPAGPICSPGMASIEAALNPESTNYWYWYAYEGETTFFTNDTDFNNFANSHPY